MQKIPKIIHQTWHRGDNLEVLERIDLCKSFNPDYTHNFCDETGMLSYIEAHFDEDVVACFKKIKNIQLKADFWRICAIYNEGGVYIDIDTEPLKNLEEVVREDDDIIFSLTPVPQFGIHHITKKEHVVLFNAFIAATPKHPLFLAILKDICLFINNNKHPSQIHEVSGTERIVQNIYLYYNIDYIDAGYLPVNDNVSILKHIVTDPNNDFPQELHETILTHHGEPFIQCQQPVHEDTPPVGGHYGGFWERGEALYELDNPTVEDLVWLNCNSHLLRRYHYNENFKSDLSLDSLDQVLDGDIAFNEYKCIELNSTPGGSNNDGVVDLGDWLKLFDCLRKIEETHDLIHLRANDDSKSFTVNRPPYILKQYGSRKKITLPTSIRLFFVKREYMPLPYTINTTAIPTPEDVVLIDQPWI